MENIIKYDYHMHTTNSSDGISTMEEQIQKAINNEFKQICFTDHMDFNKYRNTSEPDFINMDRYYKEFNLLKEKYLGKVSIKFGIEVGLQPEIKEVVKEFVNKHKFDFVIGSLHSPEGDDEIRFFKGRTRKEAYEKYLTEILKIITRYDDEFDIFGHLDYIIRYAPFDEKKMEYTEYAEIIDKILIGLIKKNKGIEINTSRIQIWIGSTASKL